MARVCHNRISCASLLDMDYHVLKEIPRNMDVTEFEAAVLKERGLLSQIPPRYQYYILQSHHEQRLYGWLLQLYLGRSVR